MDLLTSVLVIGLHAKLGAGKRATALLSSVGNERVGIEVEEEVRRKHVILLAHQLELDERVGDAAALLLIIAALALVIAGLRLVVAALLAASTQLGNRLRCSDEPLAYAALPHVAS